MFTASDPVKAPASDLQFIKNLVKFSDVHRPIADAVLNKDGPHLWYLSERNVSLSFFDESLAVEVRKRLVECLYSREGCDVVQPRLPIPNARFLATADLPDFVTKNSRSFF